MLSIPMQTSEKRVPVTSSGLLQTLFGIDTSNLNIPARDLTESALPPVQGLNTKALAEYIVQNPSSDTRNLQRAKFFLQEWNSNICYICGCNINKTQPSKSEKEGHIEELEHVLPIGEALALTGIIQLNQRDFKKSMEQIANTNVAYSYLIEYARAHTCCNQAKGVISFLDFNGAPPFNEPYKIDINNIESVLEKIWENTVKPGRFRQESYACGNPALKSDLRNNYSDKKAFIHSRTEFIINNYMNPILEYIYNDIEREGLRFMNLCFLANQAISIDQKVWSMVGARTKISKQDLYMRIATSINDKYKTSIYQTTRGDIIKSIFYNRLLSPYLQTYYNSLQVNATTRKSSRIVTFTNENAFSTAINSDFLIIKKNYIDFLKNLGLPFIENIIGPSLQVSNEFFFGMQYIILLIENQAVDFVFYEDMIEPLIDMIINVNKYIILYIFLTIILYNSKYISRKSDNNFEFNYLGSLNELDGFISQNNLGIEYYQQQLNDIDILQQFNYTAFMPIKTESEVTMGMSVSTPQNNIVLNLQSMNTYGGNVIEAPIQLLGSALLMNMNRKITEERNQLQEVIDALNQLYASPPPPDLVNLLIQSFEQELPPSQIGSNIGTKYPGIFGIQKQISPPSAEEHAQNLASAHKKISDYESKEGYTTGESTSASSQPYQYMSNNKFSRGGIKLKKTKKTKTKKRSNYVKKRKNKTIKKIKNKTKRRKH
jgi:hypothetical protein